MGEWEPIHSSDFADENYINKTGWKTEMTDKTSDKDKQNSYPCLPKLHLTRRRCWTAHETPNFNGKSQTWQMWRTSIISRGSLKMLIFLFQPLLSFKVSRVKPELQILQDIPAGCCEHSRCLGKLCLDLEFRQETLISFNALASLRNQKEAFFEIDPTFLAFKYKN